MAFSTILRPWLSLQSQDSPYLPLCALIYDTRIVSPNCTLVLDESPHASLADAHIWPLTTHPTKRGLFAV